FKNTNYSQWERQKVNPNENKSNEANNNNNTNTSKSLLNNKNNYLNKQSSSSLAQSNSRLFNSSPLNNTPERKCSAYCNHLGGENPNKIVHKSKKQMLEEEERKKVLRTKIKCKFIRLAF